MNYLKKHWFDIAAGLISCGLATYYLCAANIDTAILWLISACVWFVTSRIDYNHERIEELELKAKKYDALAEEVKAMREWQQTYERFKNLGGKHE